MEGIVQRNNAGAGYAVEAIAQWTDASAGYALEANAKRVIVGSIGDTRSLGSLLDPALRAKVRFRFKSA